MAHNCTERLSQEVQRFGGTADAPQLIDGAVGVLDLNGTPSNGHAITPWKILGMMQAAADFPKDLEASVLSLCVKMDLSR